MENSNKPTFPFIPQSQHGYSGLTKREYFAALAMQGTNTEAYANTFGNKWAENVAKDSVQMADALLAELDKPKGGGE
jgi:hypothetical protein